MSETSEKLSLWRRLNNRVASALAVVAQRFPHLARWLGIVRRRRRPITILVFFGLHVAGFFCSIQAVMQTRTEQGAVAWAISLNAVPIVAVPAWFVFGDSDLDGYVATRRAGLEEIRPTAQRFLRNLDAAEAPVPLEERSEEVRRTLQRLASMPWMKGNQAELLVDGKNTFHSIYQAIDEAEDYVLVQFYIFRDDETGGELRRRLIEKAKSGVRVRVLLDNYGCLDLPGDFIEEMRAAGIEAELFMDITGEANRFQLNFRNHRKIVVVDGTVGFVGGHNVGDEYLGMHPELTPWRDSHLRIAGPAAKALQVAFVEDWHWATGEIPEGLDWSIDPAEFAGETEALILASGPSDPVETCSMFFLSTLYGARERIWIATPYFVPDDKIVTALQAAAIRGVDVRVLMPDLADSTLVKLSSYSYLEELDKVGVKLYRYQNGFLHQKVLVMDDELAAIGSANFDNRSFRLNFEVTGIIHDREFTDQVAAMLEEDFAISTRATAKDYAEKSFPFRLAVRVARMLAPIQ